ncbi:MAG: ethanolamine permease [Myxococcales bacterium]
MDGPLVYLGCYAVFVGLHLWGVGEALKLMFAISAVAALALLLFAVSMAPRFDAANLFDIAPTSAAGASALLPFGYLGIWAAIPYAMWFFLAIEGVPLAAEETENPARDLPRGIIAGMLVLLGFALAVVTLGPGGAGAEALKGAGNPLVAALESPKAFGAGSLLARTVNLAGLAGLVASFFSIVFAYSRQTFALSRAGYLPRVLSLTSRRKAPWLALLVPGTLGFLLSLTRQGDLLILVAVFGATVSYVLMMVSHLVLRVREPDMNRPYRTPGGMLTSGIALVLALAALVAGLLVEPRVLLWAAVGYAVMIAYFALYSRHRLVASAPEEEFAAVKAADAELGR